MDMLAQSILHELRILKDVQRLFQIARKLRVTRLLELALGHAQGSRGGLRRKLEFALDAVKTSRQRYGVHQIGVGHGIGAAQLDTCGKLLARLVDGNANHCGDPTWRTRASCPRPW